MATATKANGGTFPFTEVVKAIDGRQKTRAHGTSQMPVWGEVFGVSPDAPLNEMVVGAGKIFPIASHIESLQE